jgi:hypothetical protein
MDGLWWWLRMCLFVVAACHDKRGENSATNYSGDEEGGIG